LSTRFGTSPNRIADNTINKARGTNRKIEDRFDLTLEYIRRHYAGADRPLAGVLSRYTAGAILSTAPEASRGLAE
jgi:hypothetical protein